MRKVTVFFAVAGCLALATSAMATIPSPSNSSCLFEVKASSACADADAIWCPGGDFDTLQASIREQVMSLDEETRVITGHGPETTIGYEGATSGILRLRCPRGFTLLLATHNERMAGGCDRILRMAEGRLQTLSGDAAATYFGQPEGPA